MQDSWIYILKIKGARVRLSVKRDGKKKNQPNKNPRNLCCVRLFTLVQKPWIHSRAITRKGYMVHRGKVSSLFKSALWQLNLFSLDEWSLGRHAFFPYQGVKSGNETIFFIRQTSICRNTFSLKISIRLPKDMCEFLKQIITCSPLVPDV